jgi:hypothetical protein
MRNTELTGDPLGREPLKPFQTVEELAEKGARVFHRVDPKLGEYFETMRRENLLDLPNYKGKAPGARQLYVDQAPFSQMPSARPQRRYPVSRMRARLPCLRVDQQPALCPPAHLATGVQRGRLDGDGIAGDAVSA